MGSWAGLIALYARETQGVSSLSTGTSLALTASLMQFTHLGDGNIFYNELQLYFFHFHSINQFVASESAKIHDSQKKNIFGIFKIYFLLDQK